jgi:lipoprotein NlpI
VFRDEERFACALQALQRRDYSSAETELSQLLTREELSSKERAFLLNKRGVARIGLQMPQLAKTDFSAALESFAGYAPALTNLGNLLLEEGQIDAAIASYERAIADDRDYANAYLNLGVAYKRAGRIAESVRALRDALRLEQRATAASSWRRARRR